ncbi:MAG: translation initiation factor IF-2 [Alphaproteobacteria bacterium]
MTDTSNTGDKTISVKKTLGLKRGSVERGTVRQSFSHGRTNTVQVERKKRRVVLPGEQKPEAAAPEPKAKPASLAKPVAAPAARKSKSEGAARKLSNSEMDARARALSVARVSDAEERELTRIAAAEAAVEAERLAEEREEQARRDAEEAAKQQAEEVLRAKEEGDARGRKGAERRPEPQAETPSVAAPAAKPATGDDRKPIRGRLKSARPAEEARTTRRPGDQRRRGKLTLTNALDQEERSRSLASIRRRRERERARAAEQGPREKIMREVTIPETITVQELANRMAERAVDVIKLLMKQGQMLNVGDVVDTDVAQLIAEEMGHTVRRVSEADVVEGLFTHDDDDDADALQPRSPVVTIMGHVDHGKTSLLDRIRTTNVVSGEAGGITQHIGAYQVDLDGQKITFIDTPGHAAFTAMRARGAEVTDIVVLVVAADDGVMPQTIEAISHAKAAGVPIIVAINKIDLPAAEPQRVRTGLLQHDVFVESMGGEVLDIEVSAVTGANLDKLLEAIVLQAELLELRGNPDRGAEGTVIEARLDKGRGPMATVLVQAGTLNIGDILVAGAVSARVRALIDDHGAQVKTAGPSVPVEVLGFQEAPEAGDRFAVVDSDARAREVADYRIRQKREQSMARSTAARGSLEHMMDQLNVSGQKLVPLVIKGDVQGSVEAITQAVEKLGTDEVMAQVLLGGVGGITESDVTLALASDAAIIGFNVRANKQARESVERAGADIRYYSIIYNLVDDVKAAMSGLLSPERRETMLGNAEILEVFNISKVGRVAGCRVTDGTVERGAGVRLIRDDVVIHEGKLSTLKRFKDEVRDVASGQECGMAFESYEDMRAGDVIECFRVEEIARSL